LRNEILQYRFWEDQRARLTARLLIRKAILATNYPLDLLHGWQRDPGNKPFIPGWLPFNISHSGSYVVLAFGHVSTLGIDIELRQDIDFLSLIDNFADSEVEFISNAEHSRTAFYSIWVKKEAILKSIGTGIVNGLKKVDCTQETVLYSGKEWRFTHIDINKDYVCWLASENKEEEVYIREFNCHELF
jgi:4'-phosphopantetheinyl transferase